MSKPSKTLDELLDEVSYEYLNSTEYKPTSFALKFMNFIKLVNGTEGESHKTPPVHLAMLDKLADDDPRVVNLLFRGAAKTTVFMEYLTLYLAVFGELPAIGKVYGMIYVSDSVDNGVKNARQNIEFRYDNSEFLQEWIPDAKFTDKGLFFTNKSGKRLGVKLYGAMTGIRGSKVFGKRPTLAILDDLIGDGDAVSKASMEKIHDTVYKGVMQALDPANNKVIFNGTPFNKEDVIVKAVESGAWTVNVFPVAEKFPCEPEEFRGAWPDRFTYENLMKQYNFYAKQDDIASFYQELMLRIVNEEDRLVRPSEINWYNSALVQQYKNNFNFYITTDFATSARESADYSVISVWAHNAQGDWFWVDGCAERVTMDVNINRLFMYVQMYRPMSVGIETNGQQGGFISWINQEMFQKNIWFNLARGKNGSIGIRRAADKLTNFNYVVPLFKAGKMYFPDDKKGTEVMKVFQDQINLAMKTGFKGKDDFLDTISMLPFMEAIRPSPSMITAKNDFGVLESAEPELESNIDSYVV